MSFWQRNKTAWGAIRDPIKTDRSIDVACILICIFYAFFGIFTITENASVFSKVATPEFFQTIYGGSVGLFALSAAAAGITSFYTPHERYDRRIRIKRVEILALGCMSGLISLYPLTLAFSGEATGDRMDILSLSLSYLVMPLWRIRHLLSRIAQLYDVAEVRHKEGL